MPDAHANFATSTVAAAPSPALSGTTLTLATGEGTLFPAFPCSGYNCVVAPAAGPVLNSNAEIVRVTGRAGDVLTFVRGPQSGDPGGINRSILVGDRVYLAATAKSFTDVERRVTAARAYRNAAYTLTANAWTKLPYDAVAANNDPGSNFDYATNHRYTCPVAGFYQVQACLNATTNAVNQTMELAIYKNGSGVSYGPNAQVPVNGAILGAEVVDIVYCAAGDYLEIFYICVGALVAYVGITTNYVAIAQAGP